MIMTKNVTINNKIEICKIYDNNDENQDFDHDEDQDFDHDNNQECDYEQQNRNM